MRFEGYSLAILCGGKSSRMGGFFKGNLKINGNTFLEIILDSIGHAFEEILLVGMKGDERDYYSKKNHLRFSEDIFCGKGPLAGIHSALKNTLFDNVFIHSCDMPFISLEKVSCLISVHEEFSSEVCIPYVQQRFNPLCGIYSKSAIDCVEKLLATDSLRVSGIFKFAKTLMVYSEDSAVFKNINDLDNFNEIKKIPFSQRGQE